jgi:hypothetical protein
MRRVLPGERMRFLTAHLSRLEAKLADEPAATTERSLVAERLFREIGAPFWLAVTLTERVEHQVRRGDKPAGASAGEANGIFERLGARPWLERLTRSGVPTA